MDDKDFWILCTAKAAPFVASYLLSYVGWWLGLAFITFVFLLFSEKLFNETVRGKAEKHLEATSTIDTSALPRHVSFATLVEL